MRVKEITVNGIPYLAKVTVNGDNITLSDAIIIPGKGARQEDFVRYLQDKNLSNLKTVEFSGRGVTYSVTPLSDKQKLDFKVCRLNMTRAKAVAVSELENRKLEALLGK